jgi:Ca2+-binding RTX toxin-like protein
MLEQPATIPVATILLQPAPDTPDTLIPTITTALVAAPIALAPDATDDTKVVTKTAPAHLTLAEKAAPVEAVAAAKPQSEIVVTGSEGDDHLSTAGADRIQALGGDDVIELAKDTAPDIIIDGGEGEDVILLTDKAATLAPVTDEQIEDVETVSAVPLEIAAIIDLHAQSEAFAILGGSGGDRLKGGRNDDMIHGGAGDDRIEGGKGDDHLHGGTGDDQIDGDDGDDWISGGQGRDELTGGDGDDVFHFNGNDEQGPDIITDFRPGDRLALTGSAYLQGLSNETLETGSWFWQGATAQNADTRILYDKDSGYLIYASDGDSEGSSYVRIARFGDDDEDQDDCSAAQLSFYDFIIV